MWKTKGLIYKVNSKSPFLHSHASNPLAVHVEKDIYRIYFSGRNSENKSSIGFFDYDFSLERVVKESASPLITFGNENSFYSHGLSVGCSYSIENKNYLLFMGWQLRKGNHWRGDIGRLRIMDDGSLLVDPDKIFIGLDYHVDKISLSYPWVIFENNIYKMWYGSTISWTSENGEMIHVINYATSEDGINWERHGPALPYQVGIAQAFSRPTVLKNQQGYHMWFSYRSGNGTPYRIGYAFSIDGINWKLELNINTIPISTADWDKHMVCYPFVFKHSDKIYMLYNGDNYGKEGIALAEWKNTY